MKLYNKSNTHSNLPALRTEALALTYYDRESHPETKDDLVWASPTAYQGTASLTPSSGEIKEAIDEVISLTEAQGITVTNHIAYCQYYKQSSTEPGVHYDRSTGFEPDFRPSHVGILWLCPTNNIIEFYWEAESAVDEEVTLTENDFILLNHVMAHRIKPATFGTDETDSGLMLAVFMN